MTELPFGPTAPDVDLADLAAWNRDQERCRVEYARNPITHNNVHGPCITGCGRPTRNHTGICRTCTTAKKKLKKETR